MAIYSLDRWLKLLLILVYLYFCAPMILRSSESSPHDAIASHIIMVRGGASRVKFTDHRVTIII